MKSSFVRFAVALILVSVFTGIAAAAEYGVFKSVDRGRSWVRADSGLPRGSRINTFVSLEKTLFAGTDYGIFISEDEAQTWLPATGIARSRERVISFARLGGKVFAGTDGGGILASSDRGVTWNVNATFRPRKVRCLLTHEGSLYAGADTDGVFVSIDGGQTWSRLEGGLPANSQVFALSTVAGRLFAALYSKGLYAWDAKEHRWSKTGPVSPLVLATNNGTLIAGHNPGGIHWSSDLGISWSKAKAVATDPVAAHLADHSGELSSEAPVWELASNDESAFAGASNGIYYSEDRGRTWTRARTGLPQESPGVAFLLNRAFVLASAQTTGSEQK